MDNINAAVLLVSSTVTQTRLVFSSTVILVYPSLLHLNDEVENMWKRKITLPTVLYVLSKYPVLALQVFELVQLFLQTESLRTCNILGTLFSVLSILPFIGVQGLIAARTYSLYNGSKPAMAVVLGILFFSGLAPNIYRSTVPSCASQFPRGFFISTILQSVAVVLQDFLAFVVVIYHAWSVRKLKRGVGLQGNTDLATSLLQQGFFRFCFIFVMALTSTLLANLSSSSVASGFGAFQNVLSTILICEFTLELRQRNSKDHQVQTPNLNMSPNLTFQEPGMIQSIRQIAESLHGSIINELGENLHNSISDPESEEDPNEGLPVDEPQESTFMTGGDAHLEIGCGFGEATSVDCAINHESEAHANRERTTLPC